MGPRKTLRTEKPGLRLFPAGTADLKLLPRNYRHFNYQLLRFSIMFKSELLLLIFINCDNRIITYYKLSLVRPDSKLSNKYDLFDGGLIQSDLVSRNSFQT